MKRLWEWVKKYSGFVVMTMLFLFFLYMAYSVGQVDGFQWLNSRILQLEIRQTTLQAQVDSIKTVIENDTLPAVRP